MAGEKEKPLTREDVLKRIEENNGKTEGLDLSGKVFEEGINLSDLDLHGIILKGARFPTHFEDNLLVGAKFDGSDLTGTDLRSINFQYAQFKKLNNRPTCLAIADLRGSSLLNANFQSADLTGAKFGDVAEVEGYQAAMPDDTDFRNANLFRANFKGCYFYGTKLEGACIRGADIYDARLEEADWGSYIIGEEKKGEYYFAERVYRQLKKWYTDAGIYDTAGEFFFREMTVKRKALKWWPNPLNRASSKLISMLCGYGERPFRVVISALVVIFVLAMAYRFGGLDLPYSIYFSAVSFTALGYGSWAYTPPVDWVQGVGAAESFIGVFMIALFLVTFIRKMTR